MQKSLANAALAGLFALAGLSALLPRPAHAEGHYVAGVEGLQAASAPPPGLYYLGYLLHYRIDSFRAPGSGQDLPGQNGGSVTALANRLVWMSGQQVLGADYGVEAIVPLQRTALDIQAAGISDRRSGLGDVYLGPLLLSWHGARWDAVAAAGLWLDNGSTRQPASPGKGFKSSMLSAGLTVYLDEAKTLSAAALLRYELNGRKADGLRYGEQATLEWGLAKTLGPLQLGLVGYSQWQTRLDSGPGASGDKSSKHALGAELACPVAAAGVTLKAAGYREFRAQAGSGPQARGSLLRLSLVKAF